LAVCFLAVAEYKFVVLPRSAVVDAAATAWLSLRQAAAAAAGKIGTDKVLEIASSLALGLG
jgi:hypothetical protein